MLGKVMKKEIEKKVEGAVWRLGCVVVVDCL
jgi:hypothetical protein